MLKICGLLVLENDIDVRVFKNYIYIVKKQPRLPYIFTYYLKIFIYQYRA